MPRAAQMHWLVVSDRIGGKGPLVLVAKSISETNRVRYLLGLSSSAEREEIESEYFENDNAFDELLATEDDLVDAYVRNELTNEERQNFEARFLLARDRVQFARAFAEASFAIPVAASSRPALRKFQSSAVFIAAMVLFVVVLAWTVVDRWRMNNELNKLRSQYAELSKQTEALQASNNAEHTRSATFPPDEPKKEPHPKNNRAQTARRVKRSLTNPVERTTVSLSPPNAADATDLRQLTRGGNTTVDRSEQRSVGPDDVGAEQRLNTYLLTAKKQKNTIRISEAPSWIRFRMTLAKPATYKDYLVTIKTASGRPVSEGLSDLLNPGETTVNTHAQSTRHLPSGNYVLQLMGRDSDGTYVKVAKYYFKIIRS